MLESCASLVAQHAPVLKAEEGKMHNGVSGDVGRRLLVEVLDTLGGDFVIFCSCSSCSIFLGIGCGEQCLPLAGLY